MPLTDDALTLTVLREIRDEIRTTNVRLGRVETAVVETNTRLGHVETAVVETNTRLGHVETAIVELAEQQSFVVRWLRAGTRRDRRLEEDIVKLTTRVDAVEARLPTVEE